MKKKTLKTVLLFLIFLLCIFAVVGCSKVTYKAPVTCKIILDDDVVVLTEEIQNQIVEFLNDGEWADDVTNCVFDYEFTVADRTVYYSSDCGIFSDNKSCKSSSLTDEDKIIMDELIGVIDAEYSGIAYSAPVTCKTISGDDVVLTEDAQNQIVNIFNKSYWEKALINCSYEYEFTSANITFYYNSDCGTVNDITNQRSRILSARDKNTVNEILGLNDTDDGFKYPVDDTNIRFLSYSLSETGYHIGTRSLSKCEPAYYLIYCLKNMPETGEIVEKISDEAVNEYCRDELPVAEGTFWIEIGSDIYRVSPDYSQICHVENHLGKGYVLEVSDEFIRKLKNARTYPYDCYSGTYSDGKLTLEHTSFNDSTVHIHIKNINSKRTSQNSTITLEIYSEVDQTVELSFQSWLGYDWIGGFYNEDVTLTAGKWETVNLLFVGNDSFYQIYLMAEHTRISISLEPK